MYAYHPFGSEVDTNCYVSGPGRFLRGPHHTVYVYATAHCCFFSPLPPIDFGIISFVYVRTYVRSWRVWGLGFFVVVTRDGRGGGGVIPSIIVCMMLCLFLYMEAGGSGVRTYSFLCFCSYAVGFDDEVQFRGGGVPR